MRRCRAIENLFRSRPTAIRRDLGDNLLIDLRHSIAAEQEVIGQPLPVGTHPQSLRSAPKEPDWQTFALDGLSATRASQILASLDDEPITTRGAKEVGLYKQISPSVVLVVTNDALGSGTYIGSNLILTNWHVVEGVNEVGILLNPLGRVRRLILLLS